MRQIKVIANLFTIQLRIFLCGIFIHKYSHQKNHRYYSQMNLYWQSYFYQLKEALNEKASITLKQPSRLMELYMNREKMYTWDLPMHGMLPNIVMTDLEEKVIKPLINDNTIKF